MKEEYKTLFTPFKIKNVEIKNRIVMTSMGGTSIFGWMEPCHFDKEAANFLLERAKNNVGLILPGIQPIKDPMLGRWIYKNKKMFKELKTFMEEFHKTGAKLFVQLTAGFGRSFAVTGMMEKLYKNKIIRTLAKPILNIEYLCASASENPNRWSDKIPSRALTKKEIDEMIYAFGIISKMLKEADVDGVEIHAVHEGYLLDQFTTNYTNQRQDEYGGSFENRYRFPVEIVKEIKKTCGEDFPVTLRYSVVSKTKGFRLGALPDEEYTEVGRDIEESIKAAKYLEEAGYDMLNVDNGTYDAWYWAHPPGYMPVNTNLKEAKIIKKEVNIPVVCAGRMNVLDSAKAIKNNEIDAMGVARPFLSDEAWVTKLISGKEKEIRPCICCHNGCFNMSHYKGVANDQDLHDSIHMSRCALNPITMQSKKYKIIETKKPKTIAIIGSGIGGMESARLLALRGHQPTIFEKTNKLGGVFVNASTPEFKEKDRELLTWYKNEMKRLDIKIIYNREITNIKELDSFDKIIVATGSIPKNLNIKGIEKAIDATEYLVNNDLVGNKVLIIGGGLTGSEIAYDLSLKGKTPIIVEATDDLIKAKGVCLANSSYLRDYIALHEIEVHLSSTVKEIKDKEVLITNIKGETLNVLVDSVILAVGYKENPIFKESKRVKIVGDAYKVGNLKTVIWKSWDISMNI